MTFVSRREFVGAIGAASLLTARGYSAIAGANDRLRMAVIGAGVMATNHMESLVKARDIDNLEIVNVCDVYKKRLETAAQFTRAKPVEDYRRILDSKEIDWVLIATPEHWHFQMAMDALDAGKHIYVEKPMTHTIKQAKKLTEKVKSSGLKLQVGVQGMSDESYAVANEHVRAGELGKVVLAQIDYSRNYQGDFWAGDDYPIDPDAKPGVNLDWKAWLGPAPKRAWDPERYFRSAALLGLFGRHCHRLVHPSCHSPDQGSESHVSGVRSSHWWEICIYKQSCRDPGHVQCFSGLSGWTNYATYLQHGKRREGRAHDPRSQGDSLLHQNRFRYQAAEALRKGRAAGHLQETRRRRRDAAPP
jgi:Oxidoreductase family, NAD-binding Rossmann fold